MRHWRRLKWDTSLTCPDVLEAGHVRDVLHIRRPFPELSTTEPPDLQIAYPICCHFISNLSDVLPFQG
jgi:hypothetical protein